MQSHQEEWRPVPGIKGPYEVSNLGRVRKIIKQSMWEGYPTVVINRQNVLVHRLVCAAFGDDPTGLVVNHKNGIRTDNRAENLEAVTLSENTLHASRHLGVAPLGINNGQAKISHAVVEAIRASKAPHKIVGAEFGLSRTQVSRIRRGESWKHVQGKTTTKRFIPTEQYKEGFYLAQEFTFDGKTQTLTDWAQELKIKRATLANRIFSLKWPVDKAFTEVATRITNRKLTDEQILDIACSKEQTKTLAERYGIARSHVQDIRAGRRWKSLTGLNPQHPQR